MLFFWFYIMRIFFLFLETLFDISFMRIKFCAQLGR
jgi:hypothetical protein